MVTFNKPPMLLMKTKVQIEMNGLCLQLISKLNSTATGKRKQRLLQSCNNYTHSTNISNE